MGAYTQEWALAQYTMVSAMDSSAVEIFKYFKYTGRDLNIVAFVERNT